MVYTFIEHRNDVKNDQNSKVILNSYGTVVYWKSKNAASYVANIYPASV